MAPLIDAPSMATNEHNDNLSVQLLPIARPVTSNGTVNVPSTVDNTHPAINEQAALTSSSDQVTTASQSIVTRSKIPRLSERDRYLRQFKTTCNTNDEFCLIEKIIGRRIVDGEPYYEVKFQNDSQTYWLTATVLPRQLLAQFNYNRYLARQNRHKRAVNAATHSTAQRRL